MIAVDTNVLVYAHREEFDQHGDAREAVTTLCEGDVPFGVPCFTLTEFFRVVTHAAYLAPPSSVTAAIDFLDAVLGAPTCRLLVPGAAFWRLLRGDVLDHQVRGSAVFDAQIAAVCAEHGVDTVLTEDRRFSRGTGYRTTTLAQHLGR